MRSLLAFLIMCCPVAAFAGSAPDMAADSTPDPTPDSVALQRLVHQDCGSCHGMTLKGGLGPDLRAETLSHYDVDTLSGVILDGVPGTAMPPWRPLMTRADALWISEYLLKGNTR